METNSLPIYVEDLPLACRNLIIPHIGRLSMKVAMFHPPQLIDVFTILLDNQNSIEYSLRGCEGESLYLRLIFLPSFKASISKPKGEIL